MKTQFLKTMVLCLPLLFITTYFGLSMDVNREHKARIEALKKQRYDEFMECYRGVRAWEGNYCNLIYDKGGETYGGITRNFHPNWEGWAVIDSYKRWNRVEWNDSIPGVEKLVEEYYWNVYNEKQFYLIENWLVRKYVFDYRNSGPVAYKHIKEVLNYHGFRVGKKADLDYKTINALNKINPIVFILHLKELREDFYMRVVDRRPEMEIYLRGWLRRARDIANGPHIYSSTMGLS